MNGLIVKLDFDIDSIFDEEFQLDLQSRIRMAVIDELDKQVRNCAVKIYREQEIDISDIVLRKYREDFVKLQLQYAPDKDTEEEGQ